MASNAKVGVTIDAKDNATPTLKNVEKSLGGMSDTFEKTKNAMMIAAAAASAAIVGLATSSVKAFADYEQLVGGVETLFKDSSDQVIDYAETAYKTAGLSANQYMETITGFSASLLQGLGGDTQKAAEIGNMAVTDMADNANKMGTSMEMIQYAYQGFAKQNYTMLDNLKLGYGGSAGEMARLINASKVMGTEFEATAENVKNIPFDKLIEAVHKVQTEMGITGTTALEASSTIAGSWNSLKSAWQNMLVYFTGGSKQTWDEAFGGLQESATNFINNIVPVFKNAFIGIFTAFTEVTGLNDYFAPMQSFIDDTMVKLEPVIMLAKAALDSLMTALQPLQPEIDKAKEAFEKLRPVFEQAILIIGTLIVGAILVLIGTFSGLVTGLAKAADDIAIIVGGIVKVFDGLIGFIQNIFMGQWSAAFDSLKLMVTGFYDIIYGTFGAIISFISGFVTGFIGFFQNLYDVLIGHSIIPDLVNGIKSWFAKLPTMVLDGIKAFVDNIKAYFNDAKDGVIGIMNTLWNEILRIVNKIKSAMSEVKSSWSNAGSNISWALGGARAAGGPVSGGASYLVGEAGPEIFTPGASGFITPNNRMGGGTTIINVYGTDLSADRCEYVGDMIARKLSLQLKN